MTDLVRLGPALLLALFTAGCATQLDVPDVSDAMVAREREKQRELIVEGAYERDLRLFDVGTRVRVGGAELCKDDTGPVFGLMLARRADYDEEYRAAATKVLGLGPNLTIVGTLEALPAHEAGLEPGDWVVSIDGKAPKDTKHALELLAKRELEPASIVVQRPSEERRAFEVAPVLACSYPVVAVDKPGVNAFADGDRAMVTHDMMRFAEEDEELALVVGHELAHNALGHNNRKTGNVIAGAVLGGLLDVAVAVVGVNTGGAFTRAGMELGTRAYSQGFESEADYMGLYMAAKAGYDVEDAADFWRRMAIEHPGAVKENFLATHPSTPERSVRLEQAVEEIEERVDEGLPLMPDRR